MRRLLRGWLLLVVCFTALLAHRPGFALEPDKPFHDYVIDSWGVEQGLPQISVLSIAQDNDGYLWFGTQAGLARFDGVRFLRYGQRDASALGSSTRALLSDPQGRLWIGTDLGLLVMEHAQFRSLLSAQGNSPWRHPVTALLLQAGNVLVGGPDGVYTPEEGRVRRLHALPGPALSLLHYRDALWVGSNGQAFRISNGKTRAFPLPAAAEGAALTDLAVFGGELWAGTRHGLYRLHANRWQAVTQLAGDPTLAVEALAADRDGNLWVATSMALQRLRTGHAPELIQGTTGSIALRSIFEDQNGNLWLGSQTEGVARIWNGLTRRLSTPLGLASPLLWAIAPAPDASIWVASSDGVWAWHKGRFQLQASGSQLPHPEAYSLLPEADQVWIGTRAGAAVLRDGKVLQPDFLAPMRDAQINGILRDHAGRLWFATTAGLFLLRGDNQLTRYSSQDGLPDTRIRVLEETRDGRILIGTYAGLSAWEDGHLLPFGKRTGLPDDLAITAILQLQDDRLIVASSTDESLHVFDGQHWQRLDSRRGLPTHTAFYLAETGGYLWAAGMQGVYRLPMTSFNQSLLDPAQPLAPQLIINSGFDRPGGQQDKCCNGSGNGRGLLQAGQLWLPTRDGILLVDTTGSTTSTIRKVHIESVLSGTLRLPATGGNLDLPLDARNLDFEFSIPAFRPIYIPQLRYRLRGYEQDWHSLDGSDVRSASYTNLPPGNYLFEVADFGQTDPMAGVARQAVTIPAHIYETLTFRLLASLLVVALLWLAYQWLQRRHARQRARLEHLVQERTRDLQAANARLEALSFTDALTGLHNRRYLSQQIPADFTFYARDEAYKNGIDAVVFALLDVDYFKSINDTHGHAAGDRVLEQLGQLLESLKRNGDYVARWGGEEFLLVFRPLRRGSLAMIGERLCTQIAGHTFDLGNGKQHRLTASIGLVECPLFASHPQLLGWEQLVTLADRAMYRAKQAGRNRWVAIRTATAANLPDDLATSAGDPGWLLENNLLEMYGQDDVFHLSSPHP